MRTILPQRSEAHADVIKWMCERILKHYKDKISHIILFGSFARGDWVYDRYREKLPDIEKLLKLCASQSNEFLSVFPKGDAEQEICFKLLKSAYIDARYQLDYVIREAQLQYLIAEVEKLKAITEKVCRNRIDALC